MKSFHGQKAVKDKYVARLKEHHRLDEIVQGTTGEGNPGSGYRGCAVACTLDQYDHKAYENELGLPEWLARLEDTIFEGLPAKKAPQFAVDFLLSIPIGVSVDKVKWQFCAFILKENIERVLTLKIDEKIKEKVVSSIQGVLNLHESAIKTGSWDESTAESARSAAMSAARSARSARSAAMSAAESAISAAMSAARSARSARSAAISAAMSAAESARSARSAAMSAAYVKYANELIRLLKACEKDSHGQ